MKLWKIGLVVAAGVLVFGAAFIAADSRGYLNILRPSAGAAVPS